MKLQRTTLTPGAGLNELPQLYDFRVWLAAEGAPLRLGGRTEPPPLRPQGRYWTEGGAVVVPLDWPAALGLAAELVRTAHVAGVHLAPEDLARMARIGRGAG